MLFRSTSLNVPLLSYKNSSHRKKQQQVTLKPCAATHSVPLLRQSEGAVESVFLNARLLVGM